MGWPVWLLPILGLLITIGLFLELTDTEDQS